MLVWCKPGRVANLTQKAVQHAAALDQMAADDLQDLVPAHEPVLGQVDRPHAPLAKLADDLVVGMLGQPRRQRVVWRRCLRARAVVEHRQTGERRHSRARRIRLSPCASRSRPRKLSDDISATRRWQACTAFQVFVHRFSRGICRACPGHRTARSGRSGGRWQRSWRDLRSFLRTLRPVLLLILPFGWSFGARLNHRVRRVYMFFHRLHLTDDVSVLRRRPELQLRFQGSPLLSQNVRDLAVFRELGVLCID